MATRPAAVNREDAEHRVDEDTANATTLGLLKTLMEDLTTLFRQEMALARVEISAALERIAAGAGSIAAAAFLLLSGFLVLLSSAVLGLATVMAPWLAALIVGLVVLFIAQSILQTRPSGRFANWLQPHLLSGLYIDDWFTRITFRLWPPGLE
jgi:hypothetical protein